MASFKAFLTNIDYNVENMDFLLYVQHYANLFQAVAEDEKSALSSIWTKEDEETAKKAIVNINALKKTCHNATPSIPQAQVQSDLPTPPSSSGGEISDTKYEEQQSTPPGTSDGAKHLSMGRSFSDADLDAIAPFAKDDSDVMPVIQNITNDEPFGPELPSK